MKTLLPLLVAVGISVSCDAQVADSLARIDSLARLDPLGRVDSLSRSDSALRARVQVLPFPAVIDAVLRDFPHQLSHITGELMLAQGEIENYSSLVVLPDAEQCVVTRYHSIRDTTASWQAKMFSSDDFGKASRQYQELFQKLKTCYMSLLDGRIIYLTGKWEAPKEGAAFTTSTLRLPMENWRYKDVKVELELVYLLAEWTVNINIVSKPPDNEMGTQ